ITWVPPPQTGLKEPTAFVPGASSAENMNMYPHCAPSYPGVTTEPSSQELPDVDAICTIVDPINALGMGALENMAVDVTNMDFIVPTGSGGGFNQGFCALLQRDWQLYSIGKDAGGLWY
ncbi:hypothetical protein BGZ47_002562, partial [Haplosporangium gracile]